MPPQVTSCGAAEVSSDLQPALLEAIELTMLAQAQEAVHIKASMSGMKPALVAKVAQACSEFYADAIKVRGSPRR